MSFSSLDKPWARSAPAGAVRELLLRGAFGPLLDSYTRARVHGREHLDGLGGPVLFVANHSSHIDTPVILRALPREWRRRTAVAAAADYFYRVPWLAHLVSLVFNTVPVERKNAGWDGADGLVRLLGEGWSLLLFAEGTRSRDGTVGRLHSGAAVLAAAQDVPLVPVHVSGTHAVMPPGGRWMRRGRGRQPIAVHFGPAISPRAGEHRTAVMERVRLFFESTGAVTTPDKRVARERAAADRPPVAP